MDFTSTAEEGMIRSTAEELADEFGPEYWLRCEEDGEFGDEFWDAAADAGFFGLLIPEAYGGAGMGMQEMGTAIEALTEGGCGMAAPWYITPGGVMGAVEFLRYGTDEQKENYLPGIASGDSVLCVGITEPDSGSNTLNTSTFARREGDEYVIDGKKVWITMSDIADHMILVARTTPREDVEKATEGITIFVVDLDTPDVEVSPIPKHATNYSNSCEVFLNDVRVPAENVLGTVGDGWRVLVDMLNPERIVYSAAATGLGKLAARHAIEYSNERVVFDDPIGAYQSIQFPIAEAYSAIETASLMREKAAWLYDNDEDCGYESNVAKAVAVEAGLDAVYHSMQTFGGWGYAKEYHVERWWREINFIRLAPITQQMAYNYMAQKLGFPRSY